jgi:hypothetical protein
MLHFLKSLPWLYNKKVSKNVESIQCDLTNKAKLVSRVTRHPNLIADDGLRRRDRGVHRVAVGDRQRLSGVSTSRNFGRHVTKFCRRRRPQKNYRRNGSQ